MPLQKRNKKGLGRSSSKELHLRLSSVHHQMLEAICKKKNVSKSDFLRSCITETYYSDPDYMKHLGMDFLQDLRKDMPRNLR